MTLFADGIGREKLHNPILLFRLSALASNDRDPGYSEEILKALHQSLTPGQTIELELGTYDDQVGLFCRVPRSLNRTVVQQFSDAYPVVRFDELPEGALNAPAGQGSRVATLNLQPDFFPARHFRDVFDPTSRTLRDPLTTLLSLVQTGRGGSLHARITLRLSVAQPGRLKQAQRSLRAFQRCFAWSWLDQKYRMSVLRNTRIPLLFRALQPLSSKREIDLGLVNTKLDQRLFEVQGFLNVASRPGVETDTKLAELLAAFAPFGTPEASWNITTVGSGVDTKTRGSLLSSGELATLWHPPLDTLRVGGMSKSLWRELEPPVSLPSKETEQGVTTLGKLQYRNRRQSFGLGDTDRMRHVFACGKTGQGKSTLLANMFASDVQRGAGACLIDPHGDLAESVLSQVPKSRTNDVVLFDAGDDAFPVSFNPLHVGQGGEPGLVADGVLSAFKKVFGFDEGAAPRMLHIFRNCLLALVGQEKVTLISVDRLLHDSGFRKQILTNVSNPAVLDFWRNQFAKWNDRDRTQYVASLQNKLGAFLANEKLQMILGQPRNRIDLREIIDDGRILVVNLSKGRVGEDAAALLGALLVSQLQLAAMSRANVPEEQRRPFFAYVDEFQNFATESFGTILSEARKYGLSLMLANQYLSQVEQGTLAAVMGNVGSLISFQVGADDAEILANQFSSDLQASDLMNLPRYHAYIRLLVDGSPAAPFAMTTLGPGRNDDSRIGTIRRLCRERYAQPRDQVLEMVAVAYG